ncbi:MAG: BTAD domain-containing putative transcriptional regulator [Caldilineaceae bacterium]
MDDAKSSTKSLCLTLLGGFHLAQAEQPTNFATDRARALLAYLAVEANRAHRREALATLLWPEDRAQAARQNLSQTLTRVRQAINDYTTTPPILLVSRPTIQLNRAAAMGIDLLNFQQLLTTCADHPHHALAECHACVARLTAAVEYYRGPFLAGTHLADSVPFEEWVLVTREQAQRQALDALHTLTAHYAANGDYSQAQHYAARQLALEPWRESAQRQLMCALAQAGKRGAALAQYESCRRLLADELTVEPEAATVALAEEIRTGAFPADAQSDHANRYSPPATRYPSPAQTLTRLEPLPDQQLFGVATARTQVQALLQAEARPWTVAIDGIGGIGKTTLATDLAHAFVNSGRFADIAWVSAKQEEFQPATGIQPTGRPALNAATLTDVLLTQLLDQPPLSTSNQEKQSTLLHLLKAQPYLVIIDNLESVSDLNALTPYLYQLANPTKFLLTSRLSLRTYAEVYSHSLGELSETDTLALLRHEATVRGIHALQHAAVEQLSAIYRVVGGNPLALKLVVGQVGFLPLGQVLTNLAEARSKRVDELYTYIYWQAWQLLGAEERHLFLTMPLAPDVTFDQLALVSGLAEATLQVALPRLIERSLVQVIGSLDERRYRLHRLTETFLMHEVLKWQSIT